MDDIIVCFNGTTRELERFINSLHPNIKFTSEIEEHNSINFLDVTITRNNNKLNFSIFHIPTHTITIYNTSFHPFQHNLAADNSMVHRLLSIPMSDESFNKELIIIKQIAYAITSKNTIKK